MTSTSFNSPQHGCQDRFHSAQDSGAPVLSNDHVVQDPLTAPHVHAVEARRMKTFEGQRKFQAPVADDFSRGMLATGKVNGDDTPSLRHTGLINSLAAWWRR